jgi:hypothetical protein
MKDLILNCMLVQHQVGATLVCFNAIDPIKKVQLAKVELTLPDGDTTYKWGKNYKIALEEVEVAEELPPQNN